MKKNERQPKKMRKKIMERMKEEGERQRRKRNSYNHKNT